MLGSKQKSLVMNLWLDNTETGVKRKIANERNNQNCIFFCFHVNGTKECKAQKCAEMEEYREQHS